MYECDLEHSTLEEADPRLGQLERHLPSATSSVMTKVYAIVILSNRTLSPLQHQATTRTAYHSTALIMKRLTELNLLFLSIAYGPQARLWRLVRIQRRSPGQTDMHSPMSWMAPEHCITGRHLWSCIFYARSYVEGFWERSQHNGGRQPQCTQNWLFNATHTILHPAALSIISHTTCIICSARPQLVSVCA